MIEHESLITEFPVAVGTSLTVESVTTRFD
jgi:hypothetical protein